jgi:hypothetical protein
VTGTSFRSIRPEDFTVESMPARFAAVGDRHAAIGDGAFALPRP